MSLRWIKSSAASDRSKLRTILRRTAQEVLSHSTRSPWEDMVGLEKAFAAAEQEECHGDSTREKERPQRESKKDSFEFSRLQETL